VLPAPSYIDGGFLRGVTAVSAHDIWAVGYTTSFSTLILHWDGTRWGFVPSPTVVGASNLLYSVAAVSANDVWAVGAANGTLTMHWNGTAWSIMPSPSIG